jgi:hypothetical protein
LWDASRRAGLQRFVNACYLRERAQVSSTAKFLETTPMRCRFEKN